MDFQSRLRCGRSDQVDDNLVGFQGNALPVTSNVTEQSMLNSIPFAGARGVMTQFHLEAGFIGELLQRPAPQASTGAVAPAAVHAATSAHFGGKKIASAAAAAAFTKN